MSGAVYGLFRTPLDSQAYLSRVTRQMQGLSLFTDPRLSPLIVGGTFLRSGHLYQVTEGLSVTDAWRQLMKAHNRVIVFGIYKQEIQRV